MNRLLSLSLLILSSLILMAAKPYTARIGEREYSEKELKDGFSAYLEFIKPAQTLDKADSLGYFSQYFDELIAMNIYNKEIKRRKLVLSEADLEAQIWQNPPQGVKQIPDFLEDGVFSLERYQKALMEEESFKREVMQVSRDMYSYHALLAEVKSEAQVDEAAVQEKWLNTATTADAEIIYFDYSRLKHIEATPQEARDYYESIKEREYKKYGGRSLYYVQFTGASSRATSSPEALQKSAADSRALYNLAREIGIEAAAKGLKYELKETPLFSRNDPFIRGIGREPRLISLVFSQKPGSLLEPYQNSMGDTFVLAIGQEKELYYEAFEPLAQIMQMRANSLKRAAKNREIYADFIARYTPEEYLAAAERDSLTIVKQNGISLASSFAPIGEVEALNKAILSTPVDSFSPPVEYGGMHYLARVKARTLPQPEAWEQLKDKLLASAREEAEQAYMDEWFQMQKAALKIIYPPEIATSNPQNK
ncbi:MAG: SurA N-terminal domain-containing protein [Candidatus Cloacimonadaceae bacterium]